MTTCFCRSRSHPNLHSFPTRRSSDLACLVRFESSSVPTTLPTAYDVYPLDGRHDGGYYTVMATIQRIKDRKSGSAGMPRPNSYADFCLKTKTNAIAKQINGKTVILRR